MKIINDTTRQITTDAEYQVVVTNLNATLGIGDRERIKLLAENEGPIVGLTESGAVAVLWPPDSRAPGGRPACHGSSAGGVLRRDDLRAFDFRQAVGW